MTNLVAWSVPTYSVPFAYWCDATGHHTVVYTMPEYELYAGGGK